MGSYSPLKASLSLRWIKAKQGTYQKVVSHLHKSYIMVLCMLTSLANVGVWHASVGANTILLDLLFLFAQIKHFVWFHKQGFLVRAALVLGYSEFVFDLPEPGKQFNFQGEGILPSCVNLIICCACWDLSSIPKPRLEPSFLSHMAGIKSILK